MQQLGEAGEEEGEVQQLGEAVEGEGGAVWGGFSPASRWAPALPSMRQLFVVALLTRRTSEKRLNHILKQQRSLNENDLMT